MSAVVVTTPNFLQGVEKLHFLLHFISIQNSSQVEHWHLASCAEKMRRHLFWHFTDMLGVFISRGTWLPTDL